MTESDLVLAWARAFGLTLILELAVAAPLLARHMASLPRRLALVAFAQLVSHPLVWFVFPVLHQPRGAFLVSVELWSWLAEAAFYAVTLPSLPPRRALGISLAANAASLAGGLVARGLGANV